MKTQAPRSLAASLAAAALLGLLSACSTTGMAPAVAADGQAENAAAEKDFITGSRIAKKTTDRMIRRTDNAGAKEMSRDQPPNPGPVFN